MGTAVVEAIAVEDQDTVVEDQDTAVVEAIAVEDQDTAVEDQGTTMEDQDTAVEDQDTAVEDQDTTMVDQDTTVEDQDTAVVIEMSIEFLVLLEHFWVLWVGDNFRNYLLYIHHKMQSNSFHCN